MEANGSGTVGKLYLTQSLKSGIVTITGHVSNLKIGRHGFHVHNNGETGNECKDAGGHFNPDDVRRIDYYLVRGHENQIYCCCIFCVFGRYLIFFLDGSWKTRL